MTLTDPREALAEQSTFISYLMAVVSLGHVARALGDGPRQGEPLTEADDFVYLLMGVAQLGDTVGRFAETPTASEQPEAASWLPTEGRWLR